MWKDTFSHGVHMQSLEVRRRKVAFELFSKIEEGVEALRDQDVLRRDEIKQKDVNK